MQTEKIHDVIGIGFGPSNLALAVAVSENEQARDIDMLFLEQKPEFSWHPGMLLPGTEMQVSFLKDLATLRNPCSQYTFLNYLRQAGRLAAFANLRHFYPSRLEFNDYLRWVATQLSRFVRYGQQVVSVTALGPAPHAVFEIITRETNGEQRRFLARNLVVAPGGQAAVPFPVNAPANKVWHSAQYLQGLGQFAQNQPNPEHVVVIGRGQSAAEITRDLYQRYPRAKVSCIYRGFGMKPADDSEFVNQVFDHEFVDFMYNSDPDLRASLLQEHQDTNYSVVDADLIRELYTTWYREKISGQPRLNFYNFVDVQDVQETREGVALKCRHLIQQRPMELQADAVILATGYSYPNPPKLLESLRGFLCLDSQGNNVSISRHYRVETDERLAAGIYLQGCNEQTHGLSDTLLSVLPLRAQEILDDLLENRTARTRS